MSDDVIAIGTTMTQEQKQRQIDADNDFKRQVQGRMIREPNLFV